MEKPNLDKLKNKGTAATAATIAAAGVLIGGAFEAPADILQNDDMAPAPAPIIEVLDAQAEPDGGDGEDEAVAEEKEEKQETPASGSREDKFRMIESLLRNKGDK